MKNLITCLVVCMLSGVVSADTPVVYEDFKLLASDSADYDHFGDSVSISSDGTTAIVGAPYNEDNGTNSGSAYIYELVQGIWQEIKLLASDAATGHQFGTSVSISSDGTTALIGATGTNSTAYIYELVGGTWQETKLHASDGVSTDRLGQDVSISGDGTTAIVGAPGRDDNGLYTGAAYIYRLTRGTWQETKILASDGVAHDYFGENVSISSNGATFIVGADGDDVNGSDSGSAYIYKLIDGDWQETKLLPTDGAGGNQFGENVSISSDGTTAIVGSMRDDDGGSAYIYKFIDGDWQETKLNASDEFDPDNFGSSVSISINGTTAIVGAYTDDGNSEDSGSAYMYELIDGDWQETKLLASDGVTSDYFGRSIAISGGSNTAIVGAQRDGEDDYGSAYIFYLVEPVADADFDGVPDKIDNCYLYNPDQADCNENGVGDVCDIADGISNDANGNAIPDECDDSDDDGVSDDIDNCYLYNPDQADCNENEVGDVCDITDGISNDINDNDIPDECEDADGDGVLDDMDAFPNDPNEWADSDGDGMGDNEDLATLGACCVNSGCDLLAQVTCSSLGGTWLGAKGGGCANCPTTCAADINGDSQVNVNDLIILIAAWGVCP